jgi:hypothetical protein
MNFLHRKREGKYVRMDKLLGTKKPMIVGKNVMNMDTTNTVPA